VLARTRIITHPIGDETGWTTARSLSEVGATSVHSKPVFACSDCTFIDEIHRAALDKKRVGRRNRAVGRLPTYRSTTMRGLCSTMPTRPAKLRDCCLLIRVWIPTAGTSRDLNEIAGTEAPQRAPAPAVLDACRQVWDLRLVWHGKSRAGIGVTSVSPFFQLAACGSHANRNKVCRLLLEFRNLGLIATSVRPVSLRCRVKATFASSSPPTRLDYPWG
jgi:hypothetical protein